MWVRQNTHSIMYSLVLFLLDVLVVGNFWRLDNDDPDGPGALQEPPDLVHPQILTPDQSRDLVERKPHDHRGFLQLKVRKEGRRRGNGSYSRGVTSWIMSDIPSSSSSGSVVAGGSKDKPEPTDWRHTKDSDVVQTQKWHVKTSLSKIRVQSSAKY